MTLVGLLPTKGLLRMSSTPRAELVFKASNKRRAPSLDRPHLCRSTAVQQVTKQKAWAKILQKGHQQQKIISSLVFLSNPHATLQKLTFYPEVLRQFISKSSSTPVSNQSVTIKGDPAETSHYLKLWLSIPQRLCPCCTMPLHSLMLRKTFHILHYD